MRDDGLTDEEGEVMDALCDAVNAFDDLENQHPDEERDFYDCIHRQQDLLAARAMRRLYPADLEAGTGGWVTFRDG